MKFENVSSPFLSLTLETQGPNTALLESQYEATGVCSGVDTSLDRSVSLPRRK